MARKVKVVRFDSKISEISSGDSGESKSFESPRFYTKFYGEDNFLKTNFGIQSPRSLEVSE